MRMHMTFSCYMSTSISPFDTGNFCLVLTWRLIDRVCFKYKSIIDRMFLVQDYFYHKSVSDCYFFTTAISYWLQTRHLYTSFRKRYGNKKRYDALVIMAATFVTCLLIKDKIIWPTEKFAKGQKGLAWVLAT